jgi:hypothetical protein
VLLIVSGFDYLVLDGDYKTFCLRIGIACRKPKWGGFFIHVFFL